MAVGGRPQPPGAQDEPEKKGCGAVSAGGVLHWQPSLHPEPSPLPQLPPGYAAVPAVPAVLEVPVAPIGLQVAKSCWVRRRGGVSGTHTLEPKAGVFKRKNANDCSKLMNND